MKNTTLRTSLKAFVVVSGLSLTACAEHIGRDELLDQIHRGTPPPIVDVRSRSEFEAAHVPGAVHIPFYAILADSADLPEPTEAGQPIVVYCEHGPRAGVARAQLWFVSDEPVRFLDGHMTAWKSDGLPVERVDDPAAADATE